MHQMLVQRPFKKAGIQNDSNKSGRALYESPEHQFKCQCVLPFLHFPLPPQLFVSLHLGQTKDSLGMRYEIRACTLFDKVLTV